MPPLPELTLAVPDDLRFIMDLGVAVALALVGGIIAVRLRQPPIVGYLLAGVVIGPFTPGFVGDTAQISELAEVHDEPQVVWDGECQLGQGRHVTP